MGRTKMKAFVISALLGLAAAAPAPAVSSHVISSGHGAVVSHGSHAPHLGLAHHGVVAHPVAHGLHHGVVAHPVAHGFHHGVVAHPVAHHGLVAHPVAHAVHHAPIVHHAPVVHHAPAYAPVHAAPAYVEPAYVDEPYTYQYGVADDYSKANFNAAETADAAGVVSGSYDVALPDGRTQHVKYTSDNYNGYVADVTYDGVAVYPDAPAYAPAPAYHA